MIYLLFYLFVELFFFFKIGFALGFLNSFLEIVFSAIFGLVILINMNTSMRDSLALLSSRKIDVNEFFNINILKTLGAFLLILPGFLGDILGALMLSYAFVKINVNKNSLKSHEQNRDNFKEDIDVIDVEVVDNSRTIK